MIVRCAVLVCYIIIIIIIITLMSTLLVYATLHYIINISYIAGGLLSKLQRSPLLVPLHQ